MLTYEYFDIEPNEDGIYENFEIIIGTAEEIRKVYNQMVDNCDNTNLYPLYADKPLFANREYGLSVDYNERWFHVISADVAKEIIQEYGMNRR